MAKHDKKVSFTYKQGNVNICLKGSIPSCYNFPSRLLFVAQIVPVSEAHEFAGVFYYVLQ